MITDFEIPRTHLSFESGIQLSFPLKAAMTGSCFSGKVAEFLKAAGADVMENPTGIVYNPVSLEQAIRHAALDIPYTNGDFLEYGGLFHGFEHHGCFSRTCLDEALALAESKRTAFREHLRACDLFIITAGTAVVWKHRKTGRIMANCHKLPESCFERFLLSVTDCENAFRAMIRDFRSINPEAPVVLTVSPVRHHPGDPMLNSLSKAHLLSAERAVEESVYFPSYEILNDELRDYRFYREDLIHPTEEAERYICSTFFQAVFGEKGNELFRKALHEIKSHQHHPIRKE